MLSPKRVKFRKQQRGRMRGVATRGNTIAFGQFALQAQECGWITSRQIEASRRAMTRYVKRGGKIWIRIFPDKPVTMRPAETRMGSGKGNPEFCVAVIKPGRILFEMGGEEITEEIAKEAEVEDVIEEAPAEEASDDNAEAETDTESDNESEEDK